MTHQPRKLFGASARLSSVQTVHHRQRTLQVIGQWLPIPWAVVNNTSPTARDETLERTKGNFVHFAYRSADNPCAEHEQAQSLRSGREDPIVAAARSNHTDGHVQAISRVHTMGRVRTLVVSWHWPTTNRASAGVLGSLFSSAPAGAFRVLTRSFLNADRSNQRQSPKDLDRRVPRESVPWPFDDQSQPSLHAWPALVMTLFRMLRRSRTIHSEWRIDRVMAVYPHRFSLLYGWWVARRLNVPLVLYMHDLCAEALTFRNPIRRWLWTAIDRMCLRSSWLIFVPTEEFADHYRRRGLSQCAVLPHCMPRTVRRARSAHQNGSLHLVYSGQVYEPHADAARAFISATRDLANVRVTYLSHPSGCGGLLGEVGARWVGHDEAMAEIGAADVLVVLLGEGVGCRDEVMGCFPSKIIDYLATGRPILAVVPAGSFVDRFITQSGCGVVVRDQDPSSIQSAVARLQDAALRERMADAAESVASKLLSERWMEQLLACLRNGASAGMSPRFRTSQDPASIPVGGGGEAISVSTTGASERDRGSFDDIHDAPSSLNSVGVG